MAPRGTILAVLLLFLLAFVKAQSAPPPPTQSIYFPPSPSADFTIAFSGSTVYMTSQTIHLAASIQPDGTVSRYIIAWSCTPLSSRTSTYCPFQNQVVAANGGTQLYVKPAASDYGQYLFSISVQQRGNASNAASASITVQLQGTTPPTDVAIEMTEGNANGLNPSQRLTLQGSYSSVWFKDQITVRWYQAPSDVIRVNLSNSDVTSTGANQNLMVVKPNVLQPGQSYTFVYTVTDPGGSSSANLTVSVNQPPRPLTPPGLTVNPSSGTPLSTNFSVSADGLWYDNAPPLMYRFSYSLPGGSAQPIMLTPYQSTANAVSVLPPGLSAANYQLNVYVEVMDSYGLVGSASVAVTSQWPPDANADVSATSDTILTTVDNAVSSGETSTALVYINGLSTLLNGDTGSTAASPAPVQKAKSSRYKMLQAVSGLTSSLTSGVTSTLVSSVVSVAATVSSIVAIPSELTSEAQSVAFSVLTSSLTALLNAKIAVDAVTVQPIFDTLSSLQLVSNNSVTQGLQIKSIADQTAQALLQGVQAGEASVCVASSGIAMSVQRNDGLSDLTLATNQDSGCAGALASATFAVPSNAMPSGMNTDSQVLVVGLDPYHTGQNLVSTGVSSLTLRKPGGSNLAVSGLTSAITFAMPLNVTGVNTGPSSAKCEYFDVNARAYKTGGCVSLPNPHPQGLAISWRNNAVLQKKQPIEELWTIDLTGTNCQELLGFKDPNGNGFRRFNSTVTGANCTLTDANQPCFWNETIQAFQGQACVFDDTLECACTHLTDFAGMLQPPDVYVLSLSDLSALTSAYKTPIPLIVMGVLALLMVTGDVLMRYFVKSQRRLLFLELMSVDISGGWKGIPRYGYKGMPNGAYTWSFHEEPRGARYTGNQDMNGDGKIDNADAFPGPGPLLASKLGIMYARLCTALPTYAFISAGTSRHVSRAPSPYLFSNAFATDTGARGSPPVGPPGPSAARLSVSGNTPVSANVTPKNASVSRTGGRLSTPVSQGKPSGSRTSTPGGSTEQDDTPERSSVEATETGIIEPAIVGESLVSRFVGTALVLGYLDAWGVLTSSELASHVSLASAYFEQQGLIINQSLNEEVKGVTAFGLARQHALLIDFRAYMEKLKVMLWNNLNRRGWRKRAQIWRLVLLQQKDGSYDLHSDFARALRAPGIDDLDFAAQLAQQQRSIKWVSTKPQEHIPSDTLKSQSEKPLLARSAPETPRLAETEPEIEAPDKNISGAALAVAAGLRFKERRGEEDIEIYLDRNQTKPIATARSAHVGLLHDMKDLFDYLAWRVERSTGRVGVQFNTVLDLPHHQNLLDKRVYKQPNSRHINEQISRIADVHAGMSLLCLYRANLAPRTSMRPRWWLKKITSLENRRDTEEEPEPPVEETPVHIDNELFENATVAVAQKTPETLRFWADAQPIPQGILGFVSAKVAEREQSVLANKVWATTLACAFTRRQTETWLRSPDDGNGNPRAVFHSARAWLDEVVGDQSLVDTWLQDAERVLDQWEEQLRQALQDVMKAVDTATVLKHLRKECSRLLWQLRSLSLKGTWNVLARRKLLRVFLSTERWLSALIQRPGFVVRVCCVWLGSLMINTWMHYSRTIACCGDLKAQLCTGQVAANADLCSLSCKNTTYIPNCGVKQTEPTCGALLDAYSEFDLHGCTAFPNGTTASNLWMSLISILLLFPIQILMAMLFTMSISSHVLLTRWAQEAFFTSIKRSLLGVFSKHPPKPAPLSHPQMEQHPKSNKGKNAIAPEEPSSPRALLSGVHVAEEAEELIADATKARRKHTWLVGSAYAIAGLFFGACALVIAIFSVKLSRDVGKGHENDVLNSYVTALVLQQCVWTGTKYLLQPAQNLLKESAMYYFFIKLSGDMFSWEEGLRDLGGFIASLNIDLSLITQAGAAFAVETGVAAASQALPPPSIGVVESQEENSTVPTRT